MLNEENSTCSETCSDKSSPITQCIETYNEFTASFIINPSFMSPLNSTSISSSGNSTITKESSECCEVCSEKTSPITQLVEMDHDVSASFIMNPSMMSPIKSTSKNNSKKKAGRKTSDDTLILGVFLRTQNKRPPKKEYLRCQLIRGHKRIIRNIANTSIPMKTLNQIQTSKECFDAYDKLKQCYEKNKEVLQIVCKTEQGPKTDGQTKRQKMEEKTKDLSKSFNNTYCKSYFESSEVRESYQLYIDYLFSNDSPSELCKKFKFSCCQTMHTSECTYKWNTLRYYVSNKMLIDLGVRPWEYRKVTLIDLKSEVIQKPPQIRQIELEILEISKQLELKKQIDIDSQIANPHWFRPVLINRNIF